MIDSGTRRTESDGSIKKRINEQVFISKRSSKNL